MVLPKKIAAEKHTINDNLLFNESEIKVKHQGISYSLKKSDTYGYRDTKGIDYRFSDNKALKLLSKGEGLLLYVYETHSTADKGNFKYVSLYYFSKDIASTPQILTKDNIKATYPDNHKFHDAIDATFKDDKELAGYDNFHKMYKVSHILLMNSR